MRILLIMLLVTLVHGSLAAPGKVRTLQNSGGSLHLALENSVSRKLYRSLLISPIDSWIIVRASLVNDRVSGARIVQSEANGIWDKLALGLTDDSRVVGAVRVGSNMPITPIKSHLLIYNIKDGKMAVFVLHLDKPGDLLLYEWYGMASVAVLKDNKWTPIQTPKLPKRSGLIPGP